MSFLFVLAWLLLNWKSWGNVGKCGLSWLDVPPVQSLHNGDRTSDLPHDMPQWMELTTIPKGDHHGKEKKNHQKVKDQVLCESLQLYSIKPTRNSRWADQVKPKQWYRQLLTQIVVRLFSTLKAKNSMSVTLIKGYPVNFHRKFLHNYISF